MTGPGFPPPDTGMQFLNGYKTVTGLLGSVVVGVVTVLKPNLAPAIQAAAGWIIPTGYGVFGTLLALGVIHKKEKANL